LTCDGTLDRFRGLKICEALIGADHDLIGAAFRRQVPQSFWREDIESK
jgi:hypothetical protein